MKRILIKGTSLLMATIMLAAVTVGCGASKEKSGEESTVSSTAQQTQPTTELPSKEPVTVTWFGAALSPSLIKAIDDSVVLKELYKRTGVTIDQSSTLGVTDPTTKLSMLIAADDLPDIVTVGDGAAGLKVLTAKAAIPLDNLIETNGPDLAKNCKIALAMSKVLVSDDKNTLYFIPGNTNGGGLSPNACGNAWNVRWDLYKKLGYPKINTYDDFLKVLQDMMKLEPVNKDGKKNYGLGLFEAETWGTYLVDKPYANYQGMFVFGSYVAQIDTLTDEMVPRLTDPNSTYWQAMKFFNKAYKMGILDPESATLTNATWTAKGMTGRYMSHPWATNFDGQFIADKTPEKGYAPLLFANNEKAIYIETIQDGGDQYLTFISNKCKTPDRAMDLINYLASVEGAALQHLGIEGDHYTIEEGKVVLPIDKMKAEGLKDPNYARKQGINIFNNWSFLSLNGLKDAKGNDLNPNNNGANVTGTMTDVQKDYCKYYGYGTVTEVFKKVPKYLVPFSLASKLKTEAGSDLSVKETNITNFTNANEVKIMFSKTEADFDKAKAKFISDIQKMGAEEVLKYYSTQYKEMQVKVAALTK